MGEITAFAQLIFTVIVGFYFLTKLRYDSSSEKGVKNDSKAEAENLNALRRIHLTEPVTEKSRPASLGEIIGQEEGVRALCSALWGANPQHVIIYGPPGVGKTAAARVVLEEVKKSPGTPFLKTAAFVETDAAVMRCDERGFADPLIGSVHDPIYQGAGAYGSCGIPQPKPGAVTKAHGGVLFLDEIGELPNEQINKLLKVLEDRRVMLESSYYSKTNRSIPVYIRDVFENGLPADFRLIGATTCEPEKIPEAIRSRCVEIYFNALSRADIIKIITDTALRCGIVINNGVRECIADYTVNGRDAIKLLQTSANLVRMEGRLSVTVEDVLWSANAGRYKKRNEPFLKKGEKIIDISMVKSE